MTAETCDGVAACAPGSQKWSGMSPALRPKPTSASANANDARGPAPDSPCIAANSNDPAVCLSSANSAKSAIVPTWVAARYTKAARCTSARS